MLKAAFPGSFDPATYGHLNIIERARSLFDEIIVVVAVNSQKKHLFSAEKRVSMMQELVSHWDNVTVCPCDTLVADFLAERSIRVLLRGVRGLNDFSYEFDLSMMNRGLNPTIETVFMTTDPKYFVLRSSTIKELASYGGDVRTMVPPLVAKALKEQYIQQTK